MKEIKLQMKQVYAREKNYEEMSEHPSKQPSYSATHKPFCRRETNELPPDAIKRIKKARRKLKEENQNK